MDDKKCWLVYLLYPCEQGSEGRSGWMYYCIAFGNTDEEIYYNWIENVRKIYGIDLSGDLRCIQNVWTCYYKLYKTELKDSVYGHSEPIQLQCPYRIHK